jgi:excisionase family DNA binding protein
VRVLPLIDRPLVWPRIGGPIGACAPCRLTGDARSRFYHVWVLPEPAALPPVEALVSAFAAHFLAAARESVRQAFAEAVQPAEPASPWLSTKSAAAFLDTSEEAIRSLVKRGELPVRRTPNGRLLFRRDDLDAWVESGV